jgi:hypothetical protein
MKMVKSLLLGSAAGLVAVSAGQAADLPVKAKPVEYVKVCSLYGAGFYYIPGTDVCLKLGGFVRTEWDIHAGGSFTPFTQGSSALQTRSEDNYVTRARGYITTDVREQTSYGTLRGYIAAGWQYTSDDPPTISLPGIQATGTTTTAGAAITSTFAGGGGPNSNVSILRAFIQFGGFTFGKTASFYDFLNTSKYSLQTNFLYQDYAGVGIFTYGYTQQLGNGIAATIAVQDQSPFIKPIVDVNPAASATFSNVFNFASNGPQANNNRNTGTLVPDIVGSIRMDQTWGGAQVAAIAHDNRATYYAVNGLGFSPLRNSDHPDDKWGFAVMGGLELNLDQFWGGWFSKGDSLAVQGQYCVGESYSCYNNSGTRLNDLSWSLVNVNKVGLGWLDDAYFADPSAGIANTVNPHTGTGATGLQLSTNWNVFAAIQHYWTPDVRTSLYGGYSMFKANSSALDVDVCQAINANIRNHATGFASGNTGTPLTTLQGSLSPTGCADWAAWTIGSRTLWNPVKNLDVGVDVLYTSMAKTAFEGLVLTGATAGTGAAGNPTVMQVSPTHIWAGILRVQYNFYP